MEEIIYLSDLMDKTGAREYSLAQSNKLTNEALAILECVKPQQQAKENLIELANLLINRQK